MVSSKWRARVHRRNWGLKCSVCLCHSINLLGFFSFRDAPLVVLVHLIHQYVQSTSSYLLARQVRETCDALREKLSIPGVVMPACTNLIACRTTSFNPALQCPDIGKLSMQPSKYHNDASFSATGWIDLLNLLSQSLPFFFFSLSMFYYLPTVFVLRANVRKYRESQISSKNSNFG